jgi:MtaA/CmuA family methyltransferase
MLQDGSLMAEAQLVYWREFKHDMLLVENGVVAEAGACGCEIEFSDLGPPRVASHILSDELGGLERVKDLKIPDPDSTPPMSHVIRAVKILVKELGKKVFIMGRADQGPGALAMALRGYQRFLLDLMEIEKRNEIADVLNFCTRVQIRYAEAMRQAGAHGTSTGGLGVSLLSPALYRQIELPYEKLFIQSVNRPNFPASLHICGDATLILKDMISTKAPILELDYMTNMNTAKRLMSGKTTFLGPINPEFLWETNDLDRIKELGKEVIHVLAPGGGFILGPGCALAYNTPPDNIHALIEAANIYGVYHSDGSLVNA